MRWSYEMDAEVKLLKDEQLANGVVVRFYDESRRVAGDSRQVSVRYDAVVSICETFWSLVSGEPANSYGKEEKFTCKEVNAR